MHKFIKDFKELIISLKEPISLVTLLALLTFAVANLAMENELNIYNSIISIVAIVAFVIMAILVIPGRKPKDKVLPPLKGCKVAFVGKLKDDSAILEKKAALFKASVEDIAGEPAVVVANTLGSKQKKTVINKELHRISEKEWEAWIEREINSFILPKRYWMRYKLAKIHPPQVPTPVKKRKKTFKAASLRNWWSSWKNN